MKDILSTIESLLGKEGEELLQYKSAVRASFLAPSSRWLDEVFQPSDRNIRTLCNLQRLFRHGRLGNTGYLNILPVDQGVEHSAGASFAPNPIYFDPSNIVELAIEGGCSGVASTLGVLGRVARKYAHRLPLILKLNHNELLSYPNQHDQTSFASVQQAHDMGCCAVGATIYFGSLESRRQIMEVSKAFAQAHSLGMGTILWCYLRNPAFKTNEHDYHTASDLTGQANHLGATIGADIVKQKLPTLQGGFNALHFGAHRPEVDTELSSSHPIDMTRYQVLCSYAGRVGLINSGGASGENDCADALRTAIINKRAGGMGLIAGRKAFQKEMKEGVQLLHLIQDVYLCPEISTA